MSGVTSQPNRADEVRQRRKQRAGERAATASERIVSPARPVTVRGFGFSPRPTTPIYRQAATPHPRRQLYVAMDNAGAELRLPALPLIHPGWRIISGILLIAMLIGIFSMLESDFFRVSTVSVQGLQRLTVADLEAGLPLQNLPIIDIQPDQLQAQIAAAFPELTDVHVKVELPNFVTIAVTERQPVLAWQQGEKTLWVDTEGNVFPARGEAAPQVTVKTDQDLPLAPLTREDLAQAETQSASAASQTGSGAASTSTDPTALLSGRKADIMLLNASLQLATKLPKGTQIIYDKSNGLGWNDPGGWQVYIGKDLGDFEAKFAAYQAILKTLQDQGVKLVMINVEYPNAPFYQAVEEQQPDQ